MESGKAAHDHLSSTPNPCCLEEDTQLLKADMASSAQVVRLARRLAEDGLSSHHKHLVLLSLISSLRPKTKDTH